MVLPEVIKEPEQRTTCIVHRSAMFTKMSSSTRISNCIPECWSFFQYKTKEHRAEKTRCENKRDYKVFRADWQSKRICWGKCLEKISVPEKEEGYSSQQVSTNHWRSVLTGDFHLATWLPICHFTCHRLSLHPFFFSASMIVYSSERDCSE